MNKVGDNNIDIIIQEIKNDYKSTGELQSFKFKVLDNSNDIQIKYGKSKLNSTEFKDLINRSKDVFKTNTQVLYLMYNQCVNSKRKIKHHKQFAEILEDLTLTNKTILINKINAIYEVDKKKFGMIKNDFELQSDEVEKATNYNEIRIKIQDLKEFLEDREKLLSFPYDQLFVRHEEECLFSRRFMNALYETKELSQEDRLVLLPEKILNLLEGSLITGDNTFTPAKTSDGKTALHLAVISGQTDLIDFIKLKGEDQFSALLEIGDDKFNLTPLQWAVITRNSTIANYLISLGANQAINRVIKGTNNMLLLSWLLESNKFAALEFCLSLGGINLESTNLFKENFLHSLVKKPEQIAILKDLLKNKPEIKDNLNTPNIFGFRPLDIAIQYKNDEAIQLLKGDINIDAIRSSPDYGKIPIAINQSKLLKQFQRYLDLLNDRKLSISDIGHCNGFGFLMAYYMARGKGDEFFDILQLISQWDGTLESLKESEPVKKFSGKYQNVGELFEQWINDIVWFQHGSETRLSIRTGLNQWDRTDIYKTIKKEESSTCEKVLPTLKGQPTSPEEAASIIKDILERGLLKSKNMMIEFINGTHVTTAWIQEDKGIKYYDSEISYELPTFYSIEELAQFITDVQFKESIMKGQPLYATSHRFVF